MHSVYGDILDGRKFICDMYLMGMFVAGTYMAIACEINVAVYWFLTDMCSKRSYVC